jgi:hypothetical protein
MAQQPLVGQGLLTRLLIPEENVANHHNFVSSKTFVILIIYKYNNSEKTEIS